MRLPRKQPPPQAQELLQRGQLTCLRSTSKSSLTEEHSQVSNRAIKSSRKEERLRGRVDCFSGELQGTVAIAFDVRDRVR